MCIFVFISRKIDNFANKLKLKVEYNLKLKKKCTEN